MISTRIDYKQNVVLAQKGEKLSLEKLGKASRERRCSSWSLKNVPAFVRWTAGRRHCRRALTLCTCRGSLAAEARCVPEEEKPGGSESGYLSKGAEDKTEK